MLLELRDLRHQNREGIKWMATCSSEGDIYYNMCTVFTDIHNLEGKNNCSWDDLCAKEDLGIEK